MEKIDFITQVHDKVCGIKMWPNGDGFDFRVKGVNYEWWHCFDNNKVYCDCGDRPVIVEGVHNGLYRAVASILNKLNGYEV